MTYPMPMTNEIPETARNDHFRPGDDSRPICSICLFCKGDSRSVDEG